MGNTQKYFVGIHLHEFECKRNQNARFSCLTRVKHTHTSICLYMRIQARFIHAQPHLSSRIRQDKSHILIYIYAAIRVAPDLKLSLSTTSCLQTHSHVHLPMHVYSSAIHTRSTTFIVPYTPR